MTVNQIICIGNRLVTSDAAGLAVYDRLRSLQLPADIRLIEGGLAGLDLLPFLETGGRVVFVDTVSGFTKNGGIVVLDQHSLLRESSATSYGHEAGLPYLLAILPHVCEGVLPDEITLVGLEGAYSNDTIDEAVSLILEIATNGNRQLHAGNAHAR